MTKMIYLSAAMSLLVAVGRSAAASNVAAPEINASTWINAVPQSLSELRGKVVLVEFWTFGCYNCRNVEPHVKEWDREFRDSGLVVIGVHTPETDYERDLGNVKRYVAEHDLRYPIAIDGDAAIWRSYHNQVWPAWYLIDKHCLIRAVHIGEGAYSETTSEIQALLAES